MDDYPNPDEEFELMYGDELELLNEQDNEGNLNYFLRELSFL